MPDKPQNLCCFCNQTTIAGVISYEMCDIHLIEVSKLMESVNNSLKIQEVEDALDGVNPWNKISDVFNQDLYNAILAELNKRNLVYDI
jgi:hypothetical protein